LVGPTPSSSSVIGFRKGDAAVPMISPLMEPSPKI
jgi:hypothetical protein